MKHPNINMQPFNAWPQKFKSSHSHPRFKWTQGFKNLLLLLCICTAILSLHSCKATTVLLANFKDDNVGSPPGVTQPTGTLELETGAGSLRVVDAPAAGLPANKWTRISHPGVQTANTGITGQFTQFGQGRYGVLVSMFIPSGSGVVTVAFEASDKSPTPFGPFLHLDFMPEGNVRVDDGNTRFGSFPRDQSFVLSCNLVITATSATVEASLIGGNASGNANLTVNSNVLTLARQFGAVKFFVGFQHNATFFVDDIVVTRRN